jgi:hypothetical protein
MKPTPLLWTAAILLICHCAPPEAIATVPFTENFAASVSNWTAGPGTPATFEASGGPDGSSYASVNFSALGIPYGAPVVLLRGQDEFNASGHAFEGDWLAGGINRFSMWVWNNAPVPLAFFVRIAPADNFPGLIGENGAFAPPNTWTKYTYDLSPDKIDAYLFVEVEGNNYEKSLSYYETLSSVGHVQIGIRIPDGFGNDPNTYKYGLDQPSISQVNVPGDYNGNFAVDAADYALWRHGGPLLNQIDDPDHVNAQDYVAWRNRFSSTAGIGSGFAGSAPVPEPSAIVLLLVGVSPAIRTSARAIRKRPFPRRAPWLR